MEYEGAEWTDKQKHTRKKQYSIGQDLLQFMQALYKFS